jgi:hypothetical protein
MSEIISELSVCTDCMLAHANGEFDPDRPESEPEPLCLIEPGYSVTMGSLDHRDTCTEADREVGCECDQFGFRTSKCEGCGSWLAGDRFALALWKD